MVEVKIDAKGIKVVENALRTIAEKQGNMRPVMRKLGAAMVSIVDRNFEAEGRPSKWKRRSNFSQKNLGHEGMTAQSRTKKYQNAKRARTKIGYLRSANLKARSNKLLQNTGDLKKSITFQADNERVAVGPANNIPYGRIHQLGGVIRPKKAKALMVPCGKGMLRLKRVNIPARPYLVVPNSEVSKLARITMDELEKRIIKARGTSI